MCLRLSSSPTIVAVLLVMASSSARADGRPAVLQAQALIAEQSGDAARALQILREADDAVPGDADIAFDRARIALQHPELAQAADFDAFLKTDAITSDQHLLRAYIFTLRDDLSRAHDEIEKAVKADPSNEEAATLRAALEAPGTERISPWTARARLFAQYDTNVSVLPDQSTAPGAAPGASAIVDSAALQRKSAGLGAEAEVRYTPVRGVTELSFAAGASFLGHINGRGEDQVNVPDGQGGTTQSVREGSRRYDYGTFDLSARAKLTGDRWLSTVEVLGTAVFIDDYAERFLTEGDLIATTGYALGDAKAVRVGAYGIGALRSFGGSFKDQRDGTRFEGGLTVDWQALRNVGLGARGGYQTERTTLDIFTEHGATAMAYGQARFGRFDAMLALTFQRRDYATSQGRVDNRLGPQASFSYNLDDRFFIVASYLFIHNASSLADSALAGFDYNRHLVNLGVEARF